MSRHMFGVSRVRPTRAAAKRMQAVADKHGADLVEVTLPGTGYQRWFEGPNRGFPFDKAMSDAVWADLERAGVVDADGKLVERAVAR